MNGKYVLISEGELKIILKEIQKQKKNKALNKDGVLCRVPIYESDESKNAIQIDIFKQNVEVF